MLVIATESAAVEQASLELPAKDRPILSAAIRAGATHLITGDKRHFGPYFGRRVAGVLIVPPALYLESLPGACALERAGFKGNTANDYSRRWPFG